MIDQIVDFALGFVICGLIGLAFLPLVSARARRLTLARIESRLPATFDEIEADRDLLRARFAVENRALEIKANGARVDRAAEAAELGRRAVAVMRLTEQLEQTTAMLSARNTALAQTKESLEKEQSALSEARETLAGKLEELAGLHREFDLVAEDRQRLDTRVRELEDALAGANADLQDVRARLETSEGACREGAERVADLSSRNRTLAADLVESERRRADFDARRARILAKISAERRRGEDLERANLDLRRQLFALAEANDAAAPTGAAPVTIGSERELLDLREAISRLGRQVAHMEDAAE